MHVQHVNPHVDQFSKDGRQYSAVRDGIFNLPTDLALELIHTPQWNPYVGEPGYEVRTGTQEA